MVDKIKVDIENILAGNQLAAARLIRLLEEGDPEGIEGLKTLYPHVGKAYTVGITGSPGVGKSTLVSCLIAAFRQKNLRVAVAAVDPSSPISGGALLGDRLRMRAHTEDNGVFIRSMATRGSMGGLSNTTRETVLVFDAMGYDVILIETVGVGQDEVEVAEFAHTTAVIFVPGMGDDVQAMKAGLLEIGDIFVVNKADKPGADDAVQQLRLMLEMCNRSDEDWNPLILKTAAVSGEGISELAAALLNHRRYLIDSGRFTEQVVDRELQFFRKLITRLAVEKIFDCLEQNSAYTALMKDLKQRRIDPYSAAERLIEKLKYEI